MKAIVIVAALASVAHAEDTVDYVVKPGDTCKSISKAQFGDEEAYPRLHVLNPQLGPQPHDLKAGQILKLPKASPDGELTKANGDVGARGPQQPQYHSAKIGEDLYREWRVSSGEKSAAEITLEQKATIGLRENTVVIIFGPTAKDAKIVQRTAVLESGALRARLGELAGKKLVVQTPNSEAHVEKSNTLVTVEKAGPTIVANHGGAATSVRSRAKIKAAPVAVPDNYGSKVVADQPPSPPRLLPPPPAWTSGPTIFTAADGKATDVAIAWTAEPKAERYRIDLARDREGRDVIQSVLVDKTVTRFEGKDVPIGTVYAIVASIDADHFESKPSPAVAIEVIAAIAGPVLPLGTHIAAPDGFACTPLVTRVGPATIECARGTDRVAPFTVDVTPIAMELVARGRVSRGQRGTIDVIGDAPIKLEASEGVVLDRHGATIEIVAPRVERVTIVALLDEPAARIELARIALDVDGPVEAPAESGPVVHRWAVGVFGAVRGSQSDAGVRGGFGLGPLFDVEADVTTTGRGDLDVLAVPLSANRVSPFIGVGVGYDGNRSSPVTVHAKGGIAARIAAGLWLRADVQVAQGDDPIEVRGGLGWRF